VPLFQTGPETCEPWAPHRTRYVAIEETIAVEEVGVGPRQPNVAAGLYIFHHLKACHGLSQAEALLEHQRRNPRSHCFIGEVSPVSTSFEIRQLRLLRGAERAADQDEPGEAPDEHRNHSSSSARTRATFVMSSPIELLSHLQQHRAHRADPHPATLEAADFTLPGAYYMPRAPIAGGGAGGYAGSDDRDGERRPGEGVDRQGHGTSAANTRGFRMWTWGISTALVAMAAAGALAYGVEWVAELVDRIDLPGLLFDDDVAPPPR